jgi:hypothetical protein
MADARSSDAAANASSDRDFRFHADCAAGWMAALPVSFAIAVLAVTVRLVGGRG